eukprot:13607597-Alexandrium_andersonii.AAC.1
MQGRGAGWPGCDDFRRARRTGDRASLRLPARWRPGAARRGGRLAMRDLIAAAELLRGRCAAQVLPSGLEAE